VFVVMMWEGDVYRLEFVFNFNVFFISSLALGVRVSFCISTKNI
jgi:hypothetical protein